MDVLTKVEVDLSTGKEQQSPLTTEQINSYNMRKNKWEAGAVDRAAEAVQNNRRQAYQSEADHLHLEEERGEVAAGTWVAKVAEIKARFPKE